MNLKQFKYVLTLAYEGSFSKAAEVLNIKQPSLSQYIKKIEQEVGMELFYRTGSNVRLTDAGEAYINVGRQMLNLEHQLEEQFSDISKFKTGTISIGISAHRSVALMPKTVKAFNDEFPGIVLKIEELQRREILDAAAHGQFDLCITTLPVDERIFNTKLLFLEENVLAVPSAVKLEAQRVPGRMFPAVNAKELSSRRFVVLNDNHPMRHEFECLCDNYGITYKRTVECTSLEALREMVKEGLGCGFIPSCMAKPDDGINYYSIKEETKKREIVILWRKDQYLSEAVKRLRDIIIEQLK